MFVHATLNEFLLLLILSLSCRFVTVFLKYVNFVTSSKGISSSFNTILSCILVRGHGQKETKILVSLLLQLSDCEPFIRLPVRLNISLYCRDMVGCTNWEDKLQQKAPLPLQARWRWRDNEERRIDKRRGGVSRVQEAHIWQAYSCTLWL